MISTIFAREILVSPFAKIIKNDLYASFQHVNNCYKFGIALYKDHYAEGRPLFFVPYS